MKKLVLVLLVVAPILVVWAAPQPVTYFAVIRATMNEDGSPITDSAGVIFRCGTQQGGPYNIELIAVNASLTPAPVTGNPGRPLNDALGTSSDGSYWCVAHEYTTAGRESLPSNESERVDKVGSLFFADRNAPVAPGLGIE